MDREKITRKADKEIAAMMLEIEKADKEISDLKKLSDVGRKSLKKTMINDGIDCYIADDGNEKQLQASVYQSTKVDYNLEAIKKKITKDQRKLITKTILVVEETGLKNFLKSHPELREEMKSFVNKVDLIDEGKLSLAIQYGDITLKDIDGCYEVKSTDNFKLQRVKAKELL